MGIVKRSVHGIGGNYRIVQISDRRLGGQKLLVSLMGQLGLLLMFAFYRYPLPTSCADLPCCELTFHNCITGYLRSTDL